MVLVRGNDPYTGIEISQQAAWKTPMTTSFRTVPFIGETMTFERETLAVPKEMGTTGFREFVEYGRSFVKGTVTILGRYDAQWWNIMLAHAFYGETVVADSWVDGTVLNGGGGAAPPGNTHIYSFGSVLPMGLTIRVHKGGQSIGKYDEFAGCMVSQFSIEQPENDVAKFTFTFTGYTMATNVQSGGLAAIGGVAPIRIRDHGNNPSTAWAGYCKVGATPTAINFRSFRINVDRHVDFDAAFLNNLDNIDQPGITEVRDVTCEFTAFVEQSYGDAFKPATEFLAKTASKADILMVADATDTTKRLYNSGAAAYRPYALRLEFPKVYWTRVPNSIQSGGANDATYAFTATKGSFDQTGSLPDGLTGDFRALVSVKDTDEPTPDAKFSNQP